MPDTLTHPARSHSGIRPLITLLLATLFAWLWVCSHTRSHALFLFGPEGKVAGVVSLDGQIFVGATNIPFGPSRAWTAQTISTTPDEMRHLRQAALATPSQKQAARFLAAANVTDAFGVQGAWWRLIGVPHWLPIALCTVPPLRWSLRRITRRRRVAKGRCPHCGYDLRGAGGTAGPCPECGAGQEVARAARP